MSKPGFVTANWTKVTIKENGQPLAFIPQPDIAVYDPHPYTEKGARYPKGVSPYMMRAGAVAALMVAQERLHKLYPGHRLKVQDAFRPLAVQRQMIKLTEREFAINDGLDPDNLTPKQAEAITNAVSPFWALPTKSLKRPPPHSTGGAVDLTIVDADGCEWRMGTAVDGFGPAANPMHFANAVDKEERLWHENRLFLIGLMKGAGFDVNRFEWFHFDIGNQANAFRTGLPYAVYGRVDHRLADFMPRAA